MRPKFDADIAVTLRTDEITSWHEWDYWGHWTGWTRRLWPANILRPGIRLYGFDMRPDRRCLSLLLEITRGTSFQYTTRSTFGAIVKKTIGWKGIDSHPHFWAIPTGTRTKPCTGIAYEWKVIKKVHIPLPGVRFPQIGWIKLSDAAIFDRLERDAADLYLEGGSRLRKHFQVERKPALRAAAKAYWKRQLKNHLRCSVCEFSFQDRYGDHGADWIEFHHLQSVASAKYRPHQLTVKDLVPVCSNCHRMLHRDAKQVLSIKSLKAMLR